MHLRYLVHGLPQPPLAKLEEEFVSVLPNILNPKSNSAINKHRQDTDHTDIIFSTVINENNPAIRNITEMLLIKQHNPPLNEINNLINYINITYHGIGNIPLKIPTPPFFNFESLPLFSRTRAVIFTPFTRTDALCRQRV